MLKDHEIRQLTNDIRGALLVKYHHLKFPASLREILSEAINNSLREETALKTPESEVKQVTSPTD